MSAANFISSLSFTAKSALVVGALAAGAVAYHYHHRSNPDAKAVASKSAVQENFVADEEGRPVLPPKEKVRRPPSLRTLLRQGSLPVTDLANRGGAQDVATETQIKKGFQPLNYLSADQIVEAYRNNTANGNGIGDGARRRKPASVADDSQLTKTYEERLPNFATAPDASSAKTPLNNSSLPNSGGAGSGDSSTTTGDLVVPPVNLGGAGGYYNQTTANGFRASLSLGAGSVSRENRRE